MGEAPAFRVLGTLEVHRAGQPLPLASRRQRAVLAALLAGTGRAASADELVEAAWGERLPANPRAALHTVLSRLRTTLGRDVVSVDPAGYRLVVPVDEVDAAWFEALRDRAANAPAASAARLLEAALALWRGPAYAEFADREFARAEAVRLNELRTRTVEDHAELSLGLGRPGSAVSRLEPLLAAEPWRERATALLMRALYDAGRPADALARYREHRERLADELGLDPPPALQELQQRILAHDLPAAGGPTPPVPRWLVTSTAFIGRDDELTSLYNAVDASRLVTVTGVGGVGKTRLVAESLPEIARRLVVPVPVVELAAVQPGRVDAAVAAALGLDGTVTSPRDAVVDYLGVGALLLVVDNCEHVLADVRGLVAAVLRGCPGVRIVATSRHRLHVADEQVLPLGPLGTAADDATPERAGLAAAVRLFADRVRRAQPAFPLTSETLPLAAEVCRRVDGVPLAIELAATQASVLGLRPLLDRLGDGLDLSGGDDGAGLRAVLERSFLLLDRGDRRLFAALSVFAGDFDLDAVERIAEAAPASGVSTSVPSRLARLVDASLVTVTHRHGQARYRLLAVIRAFAAERLERDGTAGAARAAHARWVRTLTDAAARSAAGSDAGEHYRRLEEQRADVGAAVRWALGVADLELAGDVTAALRRFPHWVPDAELLVLVRDVARDPRVRETPVAALATGAGAVAATDLGDLDDAERLGAEALALATRPDERYLALTALGVASMYRGRHEESAGWWRQMLDVAGLSPVQRVDALASLALLGCYHRDLDAARRYAEQAQHAAREAGATGAFGIYATGEVRLLDDPDGAVAILELAAAQADAARAGQVAAVARIALVSVLVRRGRCQEALRLSPDLLHLLRRRGNWPQLWTTLRILAELLDTVGRPETAALLLAAADAAASAPSVTGDDIVRYRRLDRRLRGRLGAAETDRLATLARSMTRAQIVEQAVAALAAVPVSAA